MYIGIDIGGTNTDIVVINEKKQIVKAEKIPTTSSIEEGVITALKNIPAKTIHRICIGTTHALNAILQGTNLYRVGVIRINGKQQSALPSFVGWPTYLRQLIHVDTVSIDGGYECDGREITKFDPKQVQEAASLLMEKGAQSLAIVGAFSPMHPDQEIEAAAQIKNVPVSLSYAIGGIGLIERENCTILDAALKKVMHTGFEKLAEKIRGLGFNCPLYVSQNNGSIMTLKEALAHPILTFSAGATNSFVGGGKLAGLKNAVLVDIGGTSTDVGIIKNGYPRRCLQNSNVGGITLNFPTPDVLSLALGGGSIIEGETIGPKSCAKDLLSNSLSFGGTFLTLTDIALALKQVSIEQAKSIQLDPIYCQKMMRTCFNKIEQLIHRINGSDQCLPVVLVGGGASLIPRHLLSAQYIIPEHANVANAYGAALGETSACIDTIVCLDHREKVLEELKCQVLAKCGPGSSLVDVQIIPYHYMPGNKARVVMMATKFVL